MAIVVERPDLPLFAWGLDQSRSPRTDRQTRTRLVLIAAVGSIALAATIAVPPRPLLVWNASESAPVGLYRVASGVPIAHGDMVIAWVPAPARMLAARRHYLPANVPLVKRVAAIAGDTICAVGPLVSVNGRMVAERRRFDPSHRRLPWWEGCVTLGKGELLLLMTHAPSSFDGRYFGPTRASDVIGRARLVWATACGGGGDA